LGAIKGSARADHSANHVGGNTFPGIDGPCLPAKNRVAGDGVEIRRGVAQFHESLSDNADVILEIDRETLNAILAKDLESLGIDGVQAGSLPAALFQSGKAKLTRGTAEDFQRFFGYLDPISHEPIPMTIR